MYGGGGEGKELQVGGSSNGSDSGLVRRKREKNTVVIHVMSVLF